ncbi:MAG: hypothetical protein DHS20C14_15290 [Phycisphaeraceae bacterium]|nr:MAG: hypothetical protein DHS20C14_15290 [Phycisphaeraceae bacterium]
MTPQTHARLFACSLLALVLAPAAPTLGAAQDGAAETQPELSPAEIRRERARQRLNRFGRGDTVELAELAPVDPWLIDRFDETVRALAADEMEGRAPGTEGIERAASYIENRFRTLGLDPIFDETTTAADGTEIVTPRATYRQTFERGSRTEFGHASLTIKADDNNPSTTLTLDEDFAVLGPSGSGDFDGPVTFVGFSIVSGPSGYLGYPPRTDLTGRAALVMRFEPMDENGQSKWSTDGWSFAAALQAKISSAARRNAEAVLLVNPPNADDPRVQRLENMDSTAGSLDFEIPVLMITPEQAERIVNAGDPEGRTLQELIDLASADGTVIPFDDSVTVSTSVAIDKSAITTDNVGAVLPGRGDLADQYVVIGGHYDHVGRAEGNLARASRSPDRAGEIHPGADDNASGTSGMLLTAQLLADRYAELPADADARSVIFLAFSAEESGLNGSRFYVDNPPVPLDAHAAMLNMDMIGRLTDGRLEIGGTESSPEFDAVATEHLDASGLVIAREMGRAFRGRSDHANFENVGIPNIFVFTGLHEQYHTADDTVDLINPDGGARISLIVTNIAYEVALADDAPEHTDDANDRGVTTASARPRVRVGVVPADHPDGGFAIARLFDGTSASEAGLRQGDRVKTWNGTEVDSVDAWLPLLLEHDPGDVVKLTIERDGEETELEMTLKGHDG